MTPKDKRTEVINTQRLISRKENNRQMNLAGTSGYQHTCLSQKLLAELIACSLREIGCRIQRNSSNFSPSPSPVIFSKAMNLTGVKLYLCSSFLSTTSFLHHTLLTSTHLRTHMWHMGCEYTWDRN